MMIQLRRSRSVASVNHRRGALMDFLRLSRRPASSQRNQARVEIEHVDTGPGLVH